MSDNIIVNQKKIKRKKKENRQLQKIFYNRKFIHCAFTEFITNNNSNEMKTVKKKQQE